MVYFKKTFKKHTQQLQHIVTDSKYCFLGQKGGQTMKAFFTPDIDQGGVKVVSRGSKEYNWYNWRFLFQSHREPISSAQDFKESFANLSASCTLF